MQERATELERAMQIMQEWERAEPGFKRKTKHRSQPESAELLYQQVYGATVRATGILPLCWQGRPTTPSRTPAP